MSRLSKNVAYNVIGQGLSVVLSFVAVRFVFRGLGGNALGLIYFNLSVSFAMMMALELGIYRTIVREVASHHQSDPGYVRNLIGTATAFYWSGYVILAVAIYCLAPVLVKHWVHLQTMSAETAVRVLRILLFGTLITLPRGLYDSLLLGMERMAYTNLMRVGTIATQQAGIFIVLLLHGDVFAVAHWIVFSYIAGLATYFLVCGRLFSFRFLAPRFDSQVVRKNWRFSIHVLTISIAGWFISESDKFVVSRLLPLGVMGFFTVAKSAVGRCSMFTVAINEASYPYMSRIHKSKDILRFRTEYSNLHDLVCFGIVPLYAGIPFAAIPLFSIIFNRQVAHLLLLPVSIMALGGYLDATVTIPNVAALAAGRPDISARLNSLAAATVIVGSIILTRTWGLTGASFCSLIFSTMALAYSVPRICRECLEVPVAPWYARTAKVLALAISTYGLAWGILYSQAKTNLAWNALGYLAGTAVFLSLGYFSVGRRLGDSIRRVLRIGLAKQADTAGPESDDLLQDIVVEPKISPGPLE